MRQGDERHDRDADRDDAPPRRRGSRAGTAIGRLFEAGARGDILDGALSLPADLRTLRRAMN